MDHPGHAHEDAPRAPGPAERREHRVPLSARAVEVLDAARTLADGNDLRKTAREGGTGGG